MTDQQKQHWEKRSSLGPLASVIDHTDNKGFKNRYIVYVRNRTFEKFLLGEHIRVLDFGCGPGNIPKVFSSKDTKFIGVDISFDLLKIAVSQNNPKNTLFSLYDGQNLPLKDKSIDYITTYVVLNHIVDDDHLINVLKEAYRILTDNGKIIAIEQTRHNSQFNSKTFQNRRSVKDFSKVFKSAGFEVERVQSIRHGRFPLIYLIRYGLITDKHFNTIARWDGQWATVFSKPLFSYVDTAFVLTKI